MRSMAMFSALRNGKETELNLLNKLFRIGAYCNHQLQELLVGGYCPLPNYSSINSIRHFSFLVRSSTHDSINDAINNSSKFTVNSSNKFCTSSSAKYTNHSSIKDSTNSSIKRLIKDLGAVKNTDKREGISAASRGSVSSSVGESLSSHEEHTVAYRLRALQGQSRKHQRVSMHHIKGILEQVLLEGKISQFDAYQLLLSCGALMPQEQPQARMQLAHQIWDALIKLNFLFHVSHFNALLQVMLDNKHRFFPSHILAEMRRRGVRPNSATMHRLLAAHCQYGEMTAALSLLQRMKKRNQLINTEVFHSLMVGYIMAGEADCAVQLLETMVQSGVQPTAATYASMAEAHAQARDWPAVSRTLSLSQSADCPLTDLQLLDLAVVMATAGLEQHLHQVLERTRREFGYNQASKNAVYRLLNAGHYAAARAVYDSMVDVVQGVPGGLGDDNYGVFYVRHMVKIDMPLSIILSTCHDLRRQSPLLLERALQAALQYTRHLVYPIMEAILRKHGWENSATGPRDKQLWIGPDDARSTPAETPGVTDDCEEHHAGSGQGGSPVSSQLQARRALSPLRPHYFWPLICQHGDRGNTQEILRVLEAMRDYRVVPCLSTVQEILLPQLLREPGSTVEGAVERLQRQGVLHPVMLFNAVLALHLRGHDMHQAQLWLFSRQELVSALLIGDLALATYHSLDYTSAASILARMVDSQRQQLAAVATEATPPHGENNAGACALLPLELQDDADAPLCLVGRFLEEACSQSHGATRHLNITHLLQAVQAAGLWLSEGQEPAVLARMDPAVATAQVRTVLAALAHSRATTGDGSARQLMAALATASAVASTDEPPKPDEPNAARSLRERLS